MITSTYTYIHDCKYFCLSPVERFLCAVLSGNLPETQLLNGPHSVCGAANTSVSVKLAQMTLIIGFSHHSSKPYFMVTFALSFSIVFLATRFAKIEIEGLSGLEHLTFNLWQQLISRGVMWRNVLLLSCCVNITFNKMLYTHDKTNAVFNI